MADWPSGLNSDLGPRRLARWGPLVAVAVIGLALVWAGGCEESPEPVESDDRADVSDPPGEPDTRPPVTADEPTTRSEPEAPTSAGDDDTTRPAEASPLRISFTPPSLDFGYIRPKESVTGTVEVRNLGDEPVKILEVKPSCQCTTVNDLTGVVIAPGESVPLTTELETKSMLGPQTTSITLIFEGYEEHPRVELKGEVALAITATPAGIDLVQDQWTSQVVIKSLDERAFNILSADRKPPRFIGFDPETDEPRSKYVLEWDLTEYGEENLPVWWVVETDHPDCPVVDLWVRHRSTWPEPSGDRRWSIADRRVLIGAINAGDSAEFTVKVAKLAEDEIYVARSLSSEFDARLVHVEHNGQDAECTVRITPRPGRRGLLYGTVEFMASAHTQKLDVIGRVVE